MKVTALAKILLVDDEREFVAILTQRLTKRNYSVTFAHSGKDALAQLEENKNIEVAILDVKMPGLDGIETLKLIRKKWPLVEVIMLTDFIKRRNLRARQPLQDATIFAFIHIIQRK